MKLTAGVNLPAFAVFALLATAAYADSLTYTNDRFGTHATFPAELFETRQEPPSNGDGMKWTSADGGSLSVYGAFNASDLTAPEFLAELVEYRGKDGEVTYKRNGRNWVVASGVAGTDIFYERHAFGTSGVIHSLVLTYPRAAEAKYNPLVGPIANSLGGP